MPENLLIAFHNNEKKFVNQLLIELEQAEASYSGLQHLQKRVLAALKQKNQYIVDDFDLLLKLLKSFTDFLQHDIL